MRLRDSSSLFGTFKVLITGEVELLTLKIHICLILCPDKDGNFSHLL